jgi:hypothetical protein
VDQTNNSYFFPKEKNIGVNINFDKTWPYIVPLRLHEYFIHHGHTVHLYDLKNFPRDSFFPIGLGFFDFSIDYFDLLPEKIIEHISQNRLKILFYYHEGDNPFIIKTRLDTLTTKHNLNENCYVFISGNTGASKIANFLYFTDFELWYYQRNLNLPPLQIHQNPRDKDFTILNRLHKPWRAMAMTAFKYNGILNNSYWSYCNQGELDSDTAIEIESVPGWREQTQKFLNDAPYFCDTLTDDQRNSHSHVIDKYHTNSYCQIVMETHFDIQQSGAFISEKTFKPIKHGQMFFIAGPAGSLQVLRDLGYKTFDFVLDNSYDTIDDATERWQALLASIWFAKLDLPKLFKLCIDDIKHNQQLFLAKKNQRLNKLVMDIYEHC